MKFKVIQPKLPGFRAPFPQLYETDQFSGYDGEDLSEWLLSNFGPSKVKEFHTFMYGQTMVMCSDAEGDHGIVFRRDWERFMLGLPVID